MMSIKSAKKIILFILFPFLCHAQKNTYYDHPDKNKFDSLQKELKGTTDDTLRMAIYRDMGYYYAEVNRDSALFFHQQQLAFARKFGLKLWAADALDASAYILIQQYDYSLAFQYLLEGIKIAENE